MADFKISRFRYTWKGDWETATDYIKDDVIKYGGQSWVCVRAHTSSAFQTNQTYIPPGESSAAPAWIKMVDGHAWRDSWTSTTLYNPNDIVLNAGQLYICKTSHTSGSTFVSGVANWDVYATGINWIPEWITATRYEVGDLVKYNGIVYRCSVEHVSTSTLENFAGDSALDYWETYAEGIFYNGEWTPLVNNTEPRKHRKNDIVTYGGVLWRCTRSHTSADDSTIDFNTDYWTVEVPGQHSSGEWSATTTYRIGDVVTYGGYVYYSLTFNYNRVPSDHLYQLIDQADPPDWAVLAKGQNLVGDWAPTLVTLTSASSNPQVGMSVEIDLGDGELDTGTKIVSVISSTKFTINKVPLVALNDTTLNLSLDNFETYLQVSGASSASTEYRTGDVVRRGGNTYIARLDTTSDGSSLDYLDSSNWELVTPSVNWKNFWQADSMYFPGDIVTFRGSAYKCNTGHESFNDNHPGDNGNGFEYWDLLLQSPSDIGMTTPGDLLTYDLSRGLAGDGSSFGAAAVNIDEADKLLVVNSGGSIGYKVWGNTEYLVNVAPNGVDDVTDPDRGFNYFKPWKTIRFACERIEETGLNIGNTVKVRVWPGTYEEILPIIVPANVAIQGDEVRSITVKPNQPIAALENDSTYTIAVLNRISALIEDIMDGTPVTKSIGNSKYQKFPETPLSESTRAVGQVIQGLINDITAYIDFHINSTGTEPSLVGSNTPIYNEVAAGSFVVGQEYIIVTEGDTNFIALGAIGNTTGLTFTATGAGSGTGTAIRIDFEDYQNAVTLLENNKEFLSYEAVAFMQQTYPSYNFDGASCRRDVERYIDAWKYDIIYTGNYKSILFARYYRNAVLGSVSEDMFYVRDATGIRNMTLSGLTGTLNPIGVFDFYQRPTGGAYVSLDPGWGPDDDRTWITTRSCYIQNCTTFGYAAVGQKIDGAIHNGGNKSIVSNDFTQVISDGIGAWVLNNGRAELVSVFTYYSQVGYLAENGGIIRATNGNNSYGTFGAMALGVDESEVLETATVYNRNNEAQVESAFAGEVNDEILILEFSNAGQNYTSASYTFIGSGSQASVVADDFRDDAVFEARIVSPPDSSGVPGGRGFFLVENNAQSGDLTSIQLAASDANEETEYLGMRIVIVSGPGTGQYGYVSAYDNITKQLSVSKESTGVAGWDHVIPGYPLVNPLLPSTRYRIEPRAVFSAPPYSATAVNTQITGNHTNIVYGETTVTYSNVSSDLGTGTVEGQDGLVPLAATFTVVKNGRTYSPTIVNPGAGYSVGDVLVIEGTGLGGTSPENDLTITVTAISDDSTNSIDDFTYQGIGTSGVFVTTASTDDVTMYSYDGETWLESDMPTTGNWKCLAAGNNKFVAIKYGSSSAATSSNGYTWTTRSMPASRNWNSVVYGNGIFVAVATNLNSGAYSINDGVTWSSTTLPTVGDSTLNEWVDIAYGKNKFVAIANTSNVCAVGTYSGGVLSWSGQIMDVIADSSQKDWVSIAYGNNRFVAISSQGDVGYSFDTTTWYGASMPTTGNGALWNSIKYAQGVFFATKGTSANTTVATSPDGIVWTSRTLASSSTWITAAFGNPDITLGDSTLGNSKGMWITIGSVDSNVVNKVTTGATAKGRVVIEARQVSSIRIWDPGSGYTQAPTLTITDPNETIELYTENRLGDGVLANPSWINRGLGYRTSSTSVTVAGDGFADVIPTGKYITLTDLVNLPKLGSQLLLPNNSNIYKVVTVRQIDNIDGGISAVLQVSPLLTAADDVQHGDVARIRERFSQCRITGHDFLDIGTGNFDETNYPTLYTTGLFDTAPFNEIVEEEGGRVFYTSTDQDGNFRTGELFAVEQATGIVTISADFFDLAGLTELRLGGVRLGGTGVVIREFSTDPLFLEDSNNVVPTQRAIKAYLTSRLSVGGSDLVGAAFTAGQIKVGPTAIENVLGLPIIFTSPTDFSGLNAGVSGYMIAQALFYKSFTQD